LLILEILEKNDALSSTCERHAVRHERTGRLAAVNALPGCEDATRNGRSRAGRERQVRRRVVAPLNHASDKEPSYLADGKVTTSKGFKEAFTAFAEAGWQGVQHPVEFGGQGLPKLLATPCIEMLNSASISFALCPLLSDGAIEALLTAGSDEQKAIYLENLVSGNGPAP
jgi:butyryl-CoA dehydrogenase